MKTGALKKNSILISLVLILVLISGVKVFAVPVDSTPWEHTQSDGSTITVIFRGDEFYNYFTDDENDLLYRDDNGDFLYVIKTEEGLTLSALSENSAGSRVSASELADDDVKKQYYELSGKEYEPLPDRELPDPVTPESIMGAEGDAHLDSFGEETATLPLVTIVISYNNIGYRTDFTWSDKLYETKGSLQDYYYEMSDHKFTFVPAEESCEIRNGTPGFDEKNDGIIHVTLNSAHRDWTGYSPDQYRSLSAAVGLADPFIDFSHYDKNGNGKIDTNELAVSFIVAGYSAAMYPEGVPMDTLIIPHRYYLKYYAQTYADGVEIDDYIAIAEMNKYRSEAAKQAYPGVFFHELGHYLGLPDLYDTEFYDLKNPYPDDYFWKGYFIELLSVMDQGVYAVDRNGNDKATAFDVWCRYYLGWIKPEIVEVDGTYTLSSQESSKGFHSLLIPTERENEYYLLENRQAEGIDEGLLWYEGKQRNGKEIDGNGIVIWHIDNDIHERYKVNVENRVNVPNHRPGIMPLFPEGKVNNSGDPGDRVASKDFTLDFKETYPVHVIPFYNKKNFDILFENIEGHENGLFLPLYGEGDKADDPNSRILSGINLRFIEDSSRDMKVEIRGIREPDDTGAGKALSELLSEKELEVLNDPKTSTVSKNEILSKIDDAIDTRVNMKSTVSFDSALKGSGKTTGQEYWVKLRINKALRYDGRKHVFNTKARGSKSTSPDIRVQVFYCEKKGDFASAPPADNKHGITGSDGWTEAAVKNVKIANNKYTTFDHMGKLTEDVKGLRGTTYITEITLEDKELNRTLGKALNKRIASMVKKLKADKGSRVTDGELDSAGFDERQLIIPIYPLFIASGDSDPVYSDGKGNDNKYSVNPGAFDAEKGKLKGAKIGFRYNNGFEKTVKLRYSRKKKKDFLSEVTDTNDNGTLKKRLEAIGNYFGILEY